MCKMKKNFLFTFKFCQVSNVYLQTTLSSQIASLKILCITKIRLEQFIKYVRKITDDVFDIFFFVTQFSFLFYLQLRFTTLNVDQCYYHDVLLRTMHYDVIIISRQKPVRFGRIQQRSKANYLFCQNSVIHKRWTFQARYVRIFPNGKLFEDNL